MNTIPRGQCQCGCGGAVGIAVYTNPDRGWIAGQPKRFIRFHHRRGQKRTGRSDRAEFFRRIDKTSSPHGCWLWTGTLKPGGYGNHYFEGHMQGAHRVSFKLANGVLPHGKDVCHDCDRYYAQGDTTYRRCVRPDHLFAGTRRANMQDAMGKRRMCHGEQRSDSIFTDAQVLEFRADFAIYPGTLAAFAASHQVNRGTMVNLLRGRSWTYLPGAIPVGSDAEKLRLLLAGTR